MRVAIVVATCILGVCALLQLNDPDPLGWIAIYAAAAATTLASLKWRGAAGHVALGLAGLTLVWSIVIFPDARGFAAGDLFASMKASSPQIEAGREVGGLALIGAWMVALFFIGRRPQS